MRATTVLRIILAIQHLFVTGFYFQEEGIVVEVRPDTRVARCSTCGGRCRRVHDRRKRRWRHLDVAGMKVFLEYTIRRVFCWHCSAVKTEAVPWASSDSGFTSAFEERCAFFAQHANKTFVSETLRIAWRSVGQIVGRVVAKKLGPLSTRLDGLRHIGIDELSYRRHHEYITTVVDHERGVVVWMGKGKSAETLKAFFKALGPERAAKLESVTIDMSGAFISAVEECAPNAQIVFDRFHVQRLVQEALDQTRRDEVNDAATKDERVALKGTKYQLQANPWNLSDADHQTIEQLRETNSSLYTAYLLKEVFVGIMDRRQVNVCERLLVKWIGEARESGLRHFARTANTIERHLDGILEYVRTRFTNARTEGLNGKIRTITKRSFGFHSAYSLMAMVYLCCGGVYVTPAFAGPLRHP